MPAPYKICGISFTEVTGKPFAGLKQGELDGEFYHTFFY
jgi:hypothetical protein